MTTPEQESHPPEVEIRGPMGWAARARGYRLMDVACFGGLLLLGYVAYAMADHRRDEERGHTQLVAEAKQMTEITTRLMRENNAQVVKALHENTDAVRSGNQDLRELICVNTLPIEARVKMAEACRRAAREQPR
jgi:hypothetical protein